MTPTRFSGRAQPKRVEINALHSKPLRFVTLLLFVFATALHAADAPAARPNIVFILTDDQRFDSLALTGNKVVRTPNIDRLAAEGAFFPNGTIASAICTPSRVSYFLGQYERRHGVNFNSGTAVSLDAWAKSYPVLLREAGYFTGYVGKNHTPVGPRGYRGRDMEKSFDFWYADHNALQFYPKTRHPIFKHAKADTQPEIIAEGTMSFLDPEQPFIAGAEAFLRSRPTDKPFCLSICYNIPHAAGTSTMELRPTDPELYRTDYREHLNTQSIPKTYVARVDIRTAKLPPDLHFAQYRQRSYDYVNTAASLRERQIREYQTITAIDRLVGALREELKKLGVAENTVIFFSSDHGVTHGEFGLGGKALNYDTCLRVPMIVMDPRVPAAAKGRRSPALIQSIDFAPTMLDLAGVPEPSIMQGRSFRPVLEGGQFQGRTHAFAENLWSTYFGNPRSESVRTAEWKYIRYFANDRSLFGTAGGEAEGGNISDPIAAAYNTWLTSTIRGEKPVYEELFDLSTDPDESTNLAGDPRYAHVLYMYRAQAQRLVAEAKGDLNAPPASVRIRAGKGRESGFPSAQHSHRRTLIKV